MKENKSSARNSFANLTVALEVQRPKLHKHLVNTIGEIFPDFISSWAIESIELKADFDRALFAYIGYLTFKEDWQNSIDLLAAMEFLDSSLLIVDDIVDHSSRRMGKQTIHTKWGTHNAMMLAIMLKSASTVSLVRSAKANNLNGMQTANLIEAFDLIHNDMYVGEYQDLEFEMLNAEDVDIDAYLEMIKRTTGLHFGMAMKLGGMLGKGEIDQIDILTDIAIRLGTIFQIRDDFIDYLPENQINKPSFGDFLRKKKRLPLLLVNDLFHAELDVILKSRFDSDSKRKLQLLVAHPKVREQALSIVDRVYSDTDILIQKIQSPNTQELLREFSSLVRSL